MEINNIPDEVKRILNTILEKGKKIQTLTESLIEGNEIQMKTLGEIRDLTSDINFYSYRIQKVIEVVGEIKQEKERQKESENETPEK